MIGDRRSWSRTMCPIGSSSTCRANRSASASPVDRPWTAAYWRAGQTSIRRRNHGQAASERSWLSGHHGSTAADDSPMTDEKGGPTSRSPRKIPETTLPLGADRHPHGGAGGGVRSAQAHASLPDRPMIGVSVFSAARSARATPPASTWSAAPDGPLARSGLRHEPQGGEPVTVVPAGRRGATSRSNRRSASQTHDRDRGRQIRRIAVPVTWGRYRLEVSTAGRPSTGHVRCGFFAEAAPTRRIPSNRARQIGLPGGRRDDGC
jgi:hypothetical protein